MPYRHKQMYLTSTYIGVSNKSNVSIDVIQLSLTRGQNAFNYGTHPWKLHHFSVQKFTDICKDRPLALLTQYTIVYTYISYIGKKGADFANHLEISEFVPSPSLFPSP